MAPGATPRRGVGRYACMSVNTLINPIYVPPPRPLLVKDARGLSKLLLRSVDGAAAEVYLHGGQVTSWRPAGGEERLFLSERAEFARNAAIRGGVPVIFPQFGADGRLPRHGFARTLEWEIARAAVESDGRATATLRLSDSRASWALWRHRFELQLVVIVSGASLDLRLTVLNDGQKPFRFTTALHTYLQLEDVAVARLHGLRGCRYRDRLTGDDPLEDAEALAVEDEIDRIYLDPAAPLRLREPGRGLDIGWEGFRDLVVWNPGRERCAEMGDMSPEGWRRMLCVEPALIAEPVWLAPGERWSGRQLLIAV